MNKEKLVGDGCYEQVKVSALEQDSQRLGWPGFTSCIKPSNSSSQWYQRMKSLRGTLGGPETRGGTQGGGKEREREN